MATFAGSLIGFPISYGLKPANEGPKACPVSLTFDTVNNNFDINLNGISPIPLQTVLSVYIDNGNSPSRTVLSFPITGQSIIAEPFSRGFYPVTGNSLTMTVTSELLKGSVSVFLILYNIIIPPCITSAPPIRIGNDDTIISDRVGSQFFGIQPIASPGPTRIIAASNLSYYFTSFEVTYVQIAPSASQGFSWQIYDSPDPNGTIIGNLHAGGLFSSPANGGMLQLSRADGVLLGGVNGLFFAAETTTGISGANFNVSVWGGLTAGTVFG